MSGDAGRSAEATAEPGRGRREQARRQLEVAFEALGAPENWRRFAEGRAVLRGYSHGNTMLILAQRPDATIVASYGRWLELGRQVRRGETTMRVWEPSKSPRARPRDGRGG
jgi:hypothetical protein